VYHPQKSKTQIVKSYRHFSGPFRVVKKCKTLTETITEEDIFGSDALACKTEAVTTTSSTFRGDPDAEEQQEGANHLSEEIQTWPREVHTHKLNIATQTGHRPAANLKMLKRPELTFGVL
jgi:hypothetical protein